MQPLMLLILQAAPHCMPHQLSGKALQHMGLTLQVALADASLHVHGQVKGCGHLVRSLQRAQKGRGIDGVNALSLRMQWLSQEAGGQSLLCWLV